MLSTKEAAVICKVALSTIVYWFDKGLIRGYRTPGGHRRIFRSDLEKFMNEHQMPIGHRLADGSLRILVVGKDDDLCHACKESLRMHNGTIEWAEARSGFDAGRLVSSFQPDLMVMDLRMSDLNGTAVCNELHDDPSTRDIALVAVGSSADSPGIDQCVESGSVELVDAADSEQLSVIVGRRLDS